MIDKIIPKTLFFGMSNREPETKNSPNSSWFAQNVKINGSAIQPIKGTSLFGQTDATANHRIRDAYTFILTNGTQIPVRVRDNLTNNVLEWYDATNKKWYILLLQTTGLTTGFTDYNTTTVNQLIIGNGTDNYSVWSGLTTILTAVVTATDTDINVVSTAGYGATGTIIYNGTEIAYTSKTATTFVVGSAHASSGADDGVAEAVDDSTHSAFSKSNVILSAQNRIWITEASTSLEYSKEGDALDFTAGTTRDAAGVEDFPIVGGYITGLAAKNQYIFIFKERTIILFTWQYPTSITKTPDFQHVVIGDDLGAINHKGIANIYNEILYTTRTGVKSLTKQLNSDNWQSDPITDIILPTIQDYDFSEATSIFYPKEDVYLVACKSNSDQNKNNKVIAIWFYTDEQGNKRIGLSILTLTVDSWFIYLGDLYFGSSMAGNTYKLFTGSTFAGTAIQSIYTTNRNDYGKKSIKGAEFYLIEGLIKEGTTITATIFFDGGVTGSQVVEIKSTDDFVGNSPLNTLGSYKLGEEVIGGLFEDSGSLLPFRKIVELQNTNFYDLQVEYKVSSKGGDYKIYFSALVNAQDEFSLTAN